MLDFKTKYHGTCSREHANSIRFCASISDQSSSTNPPNRNMDDTANLAQIDQAYDEALAAFYRLESLSSGRANKLLFDRPLYKTLERQLSFAGNQWQTADQELSFVKDTCGKELRELRETLELALGRIDEAAGLVEAPPSDFNITKEVVEGLMGYAKNLVEKSTRDIESSLGRIERALDVPQQQVNLELFNRSLQLQENNTQPTYSTEQEVGIEDAGVGGAGVRDGLELDESVQPVQDRPVSRADSHVPPVQKDATEVSEPPADAHSGISQSDPMDIEQSTIHQGQPRDTTRARRAAARELTGSKKGGPLEDFPTYGTGRKLRSRK